jgi:zinc protease
VSRRVPVLLALLAALAPALAAEAPTPPDWALGAAPQEFALDNGLAVVLQRDEAAPITVVQLLVRCGDRDEPPGLAGLAYLTARLCLEITDASMLQRLMDMGSSFSLEVGGGHTQFTLRCLSRDLEPTLAVLAAMLREPLFSDLRIDGVKGWMGQMQDDEPVVFMRKAAAAAFYAAPAYGAARFGDAGSLERIGRRDIQSLHRGRYLAGNMVAVVISDLAADEVRPLLARQLGKLPPGTAPGTPAAVPRRPQPPERAVARRTAQTLVSFTMPLPELTADSLVMASLLESWLGKGVASRLWPLRSRHGLAYGLGADVQPNREAMLLSAFLKTEAGRADGARGELARLLQTAGRQGIGAAELAAAKAYARSSFLRENEAREPRAALMAFLAGNGLGWRLAGEIPGRLERIGLEEFNALLRAALDPERWFALRIGPPLAEASSRDQ